MARWKGLDGVEVQIPWTVNLTNLRWLLCPVKVGTTIHSTCLDPHMAILLRRGGLQSALEMPPPPIGVTGRAEGLDSRPGCLCDVGGEQDGFHRWKSPELPGVGMGTTVLDKD